MQRTREHANEVGDADIEHIPSEALAGFVFDRLAYAYRELRTIGDDAEAAEALRRSVQEELSPRLTGAMIRVTRRKKAPAFERRTPSGMVEAPELKEIEGVWASVDLKTASISLFDKYGQLYSAHLLEQDGALGFKTFDVFPAE